MDFLAVLCQPSATDVPGQVEPAAFIASSAISINPILKWPMGYGRAYRCNAARLATERTPQ